MRTVLVLVAAHPAPHPPSATTVVVWAAVLAGLYALAYAISIRRHPWRPCRRCGESGKHRGAVFPGSFRACTRCGGTGRELRPFARDPGPRD
jgi:hypothetical protein